MLVKVFGGAIDGAGARLITIEVNISRGVRYHIVGLPDVAVRESLQRIESALVSSGFRMPRQKIVVNLAPAYIRKEGSAFDLPIALGILAASKQLDPACLEDRLFFGELSLAGDVLPVRGVLPMTLLAREMSITGILIPEANTEEAAIVGDVKIHGVRNLQQTVAFLKHPIILPGKAGTQKKPLAPVSPDIDLSDVKGQEMAKRALEIAAAGGHNVLLFGPPGSGKTMLARLLPDLLPPLSQQELIETIQIYSIAGKLMTDQPVFFSRPFRAPHHTISPIAMSGGGTYPYPGEVSLAHHGVLFMDELPEFRRSALEVLRQPLESRNIVVTRGKISADFPADFMLVASMNPCPCGYLNHPLKSCICGPREIRQYLSKVSGPLLDRIDMHIEVAPISFDELNAPRSTENSKSVQQKVIRARAVQSQRFGSGTGALLCNAQMDLQQMKQFCTVSQEGQALLRAAMDRLSISARAYNRILKVARTIADLDQSKPIEVQHLAEAIQYRSINWDQWVG